MYVSLVKRFTGSLRNHSSHLFPQGMGMPQTTQPWPLPWSNEASLVILACARSLPTPRNQHVQMDFFLQGQDVQCSFFLELVSSTSPRGSTLW